MSDHTVKVKADLIPIAGKGYYALSGSVLRHDWEQAFGISFDEFRHYKVKVSIEPDETL